MSKIYTGNDDPIDLNTPDPRLDVPNIRFEAGGVAEVDYLHSLFQHKPSLWMMGRIDMQELAKIEPRQFYGVMGFTGRRVGHVIVPTEEDNPHSGKPSPVFLGQYYVFFDGYYKDPVEMYSTMFRGTISRLADRVQNWAHKVVVANHQELKERYSATSLREHLSLDVGEFDIPQVELFGEATPVK